YVPSYYRLPSSDKEYLCSTPKDNGLHKCQDLPVLRSLDGQTMCSADIPRYWRAPRPSGNNPLDETEDSNRTNNYDRSARPSKPYDLVPGDEDSPFLASQLSPFLAQSVYQPAFVAENVIFMAPIKAKRSIELQRNNVGAVTYVVTSHHRHAHHQRPHNEVIKSYEQSINGKNQSASGGQTKNYQYKQTVKTATSLSDLNIASHQHRKRSLAPILSVESTVDTTTAVEMIETNENSDQFSALTSSGSSAQTKARHHKKTRSCINWNKYYSECRAGDHNPFQGTISFDNVGMAWTAIFVVISLEGWSDIMYLLQDSHSFWVWTYFVLLIVIGSFFMINLCLVVIATQFSATKKREMERMRQERIKFSSTSTLTTGGESSSCYTEIIKYLVHLIRHAKRDALNWLVRQKRKKLRHQRHAKRSQQNLDITSTGTTGQRKDCAGCAVEKRELSLISSTAHSSSEVGGKLNTFTNVSKSSKTVQLVCSHTIPSMAAFRGKACEHHHRSASERQTPTEWSREHSRDRVHRTVSSIGDAAVPNIERLESESKSNVHRQKRLDTKCSSSSFSKVRYQCGSMSQRNFEVPTATHKHHHHHQCKDSIKLNQQGLHHNQLVKQDHYDHDYIIYRAGVDVAALPSTLTRAPTTEIDMGAVMKITTDNNQALQKKTNRLNKCMTADGEHLTCLAEDDNESVPPSMRPRGNVASNGANQRCQALHVRNAIGKSLSSSSPSSSSVSMASSSSSTASLVSNKGICTTESNSGTSMSQQSSSSASLTPSQATIIALQPPASDLSHDCQSIDSDCVSCNKNTPLDSHSLSGSNDNIVSKKHVARMNRQLSSSLDSAAVVVAVAKDEGFTCDLDSSKVKNLSHDSTAIKNHSISNVEPVKRLDSDSHSHGMSIHCYNDHRINSSVSGSTHEIKVSESTELRSSQKNNSCKVYKKTKRSLDNLITQDNDMLDVTNDERDYDKPLSLTVDSLSSSADQFNSALHETYRSNQLLRDQRQQQQQQQQQQQPQQHYNNKQQQKCQRQKQGQARQRTQRHAHNRRHHHRRHGKHKRFPEGRSESFDSLADEVVEIHVLPRALRENQRLGTCCRHTINAIRRLVDHRYFQRLILLAILINAISMGIEYHNQPEQLTEIVEISNIAFTCLFFIEMLLKLTAHGFYDYIIDGFNCFDGCIVLLSIMELFETSGSGLSVLRTFRLLRILKLVRFMPALQRQLVIMLRTLDNVAVFFALLVLFIFIFSILGMNLFGCKFCDRLPDGGTHCDRKNFDSLLWSLVTVFQVLTQEDWNDDLKVSLSSDYQLDGTNSVKHSSSYTATSPRPLDSVSALEPSILSSQTNAPAIIASTKKTQLSDHQLVDQHMTDPGNQVQSEKGARRSCSFINDSTCYYLSEQQQSFRGTDDNEKSAQLSKVGDSEFVTPASLVDTSNNTATHYDDCFVAPSTRQKLACQAIHNTKRVIYFYDYKDNMEEEITFLTGSMMSSSYGSTYAAHHRTPSHLLNVMNSQSIACRNMPLAIAAAVALPTGHSTLFVNPNALRTQQQESCQTIVPIAQPLPTLAIDEHSDIQEQQRRRASSVSSVSAKLSPRPSASGNFPQNTLTTSIVISNLKIPAQWCSLPSLLTTRAIEMMRAAKTHTDSRRSIRHPMPAPKSKRFDKACCRTDFERHWKASHAFRGAQGLPERCEHGHLASVCTACYTYRPWSRQADTVCPSTDKMGALASLMALNATNAPQHKLNLRQRLLVDSLVHYEQAIFRRRTNQRNNRIARLAAASMDVAGDNVFNRTPTGSMASTIRRRSSAMLSRLKQFRTIGSTNTGTGTSASLRPQLVTITADNYMPKTTDQLWIPNDICTQRRASISSAREARTQSPFRLSPNAIVCNRSSVETHNGDQNHGRHSCNDNSLTPDTSVGWRARLWSMAVPTQEDDVDVTCHSRHISARGARSSASGVSNFFGWLGGVKNSLTPRNSNFSQAGLSRASDDLRALNESRLRRHSFSGPWQWLDRPSRPSQYDLLLPDTDSYATKSKLRRQQLQRSGNNSSSNKKLKEKQLTCDYHSVATTGRRVYKLDSKGLQTSLRGDFYVLVKDPLAPKPLYPGGSLSTRPTIDSKDNDEIGNTTRPETFLHYFRWTPWMLARREYSLFLFAPDNRLRRFCLAVINRREFDYFVLFFISMNCVTLAMERPKIPPWSKEREFLTIANYYFTFMFTLEMALKVIAKGLYYGHDAYLSDSWNVMDGTLVGFSLLDFLLSIVATSGSPRIFAILRVFRLLRSLRPLRVINRLMGLKLVVQTLLLSLRPIGNIVLICCTFFIIFGILGVQLFKGTFYYCDGPNPLDIIKNVRTKADCLAADPRNRWLNRKYNFDNLGQALMALFVLSSKDGWVNIMYTGLDAVGVDLQPIENYNEWRLLYFISFLLLVAFFVLNMFVGVVVENFHRCRKEQELEEKARRAEKTQRKLDKRRRRMREPPYFSSYGPARMMLHKWVTGGYFDLFIAAVIGFNVVFMSLEYYQMPEELIRIIKISNYIFTFTFILEAAIKSTALGVRRYVKDRWNQLDVVIVILSIFGIVLEEMDSFTLPINPTLLRVLRVMRIARVLKLLKMAKGIRALLDTVMQALPQVGNLGLLFFLLFFIFAALGVELFGRLECNEEYPCSGLMEQHAHFQNFGLAFLTLFRVATGDNWNGIMKDTLRDKCDSSSNCLKNCCVSQLIAPLYFVIFVLLAQFVLVNVVVAVLMKHLEESHHEMETDEEYELDKQLAEELMAKKLALMEALERRSQY
ncbi:Voltage-dependent T-type calcium channel subunit alpha-1I, partial [Fragariocoptes setiger]